ncbi:MAG TPA: magnesium transporter, partial [Massilibacterium sp.]|nr:magnesium transporter [Massilibacterium sp.]
MEKQKDFNLASVFYTIRKSVQTGDIEVFRSNFTVLHPYEQATFFVTQNEELRRRIYSFLSPDEMASIFENLEKEEQTDFIIEMHPSYAAAMLSHMFVDDAVDVLAELSTDQIASFLALMDKETAETIKALLHYEEKTAGSIMTTEYVEIQEHLTVKEALQVLKKEAQQAETIYYLFITDIDKKLTGVISLRELIIAPDEAYVKEYMVDRVVSVYVDEDQEEVAKKMSDYDFLALPVIDHQKRLLGIITVDDIIDVLEEEASDDYSKLAGVTDMDTTPASPWHAAKKRLPWLIVLLFMGMATASLISVFEDTLNKVSILAMFIPLIAGMAGNTGTQALAVSVRGIATGELDKQGHFSMLLKEASTGLLIGGVCGSFVTVIVFIWQQQFYLGLLIGFSLFCTLVISTIAGAFIPLVMEKLNVDPAVASGPFITTINDLISILI